MAVEVLLKNVFIETGEGPHWDEASQTLFFIDNLGKQILNWDYKTGNVKKIQIGRQQQLMNQSHLQKIETIILNVFLNTQKMSYLVAVLVRMQI